MVIYKGEARPPQEEAYTSQPHGEMVHPGTPGAAIEWIISMGSNNVVFFTFPINREAPIVWHAKARGIELASR